MGVLERNGLRDGAFSVVSCSNSSLLSGQKQEAELSKMLSGIPETSSWSSQQGSVELPGPVPS